MYIIYSYMYMYKPYKLEVPCHAFRKPSRKWVNFADQVDPGRDLLPGQISRDVWCKVCHFQIPKMSHTQSWSVDPSNRSNFKKNKKWWMSALRDLNCCGRFWISPAGWDRLCGRLCEDLKDFFFESLLSNSSSEGRHMSSKLPDVELDGFLFFSIFGFDWQMLFWGGKPQPNDGSHLSGWAPTRLDAPRIAAGHPGWFLGENFGNWSFFETLWSHVFLKLNGLGDHRCWWEL